MQRLNKFALLTALYISQGLPYGFFTQALPVLLRKADLSLPAIASTSLLTLPWALKFVWAPAVDRWQFAAIGLRRSWLLPLQFITVVLFAALALTSPEANLSYVLWAFLFTNFLAAAQDIATDGLAVDMLTQKDRGWANGIQVAGYRLGMVIGGGALLLIYDKIHWSGTMLAMAAITALCGMPVVFFREPAKAAPVTKQNSFTLEPAEIFHFLSRSGAWAWAAILLIFKLGHASATGMLRPWLVDTGYSLTDIAWILGAAGFIAGLIGAALGGALASRYPRGRVKLLIYFGVLQCLAVISYLWPLMTEHETYKVAAAAAFDHFTSGLATSVLFTLMMDACSEERAASDYTLQACVVVISQQIATVLSGVSAERFGYANHFAISATLAVVAVAVSAWILLANRNTRQLVTHSLES